MIFAVFGAYTEIMYAFLAYINLSPKTHRTGYINNSGQMNSCGRWRCWVGDGGLPGGLINSCGRYVGD